MLQQMFTMTMLPRILVDDMSHECFIAKGLREEKEAASFASSALSVFCLGTDHAQGYQDCFRAIYRAPRMLAKTFTAMNEAQKNILQKALFTHTAATITNSPQATLIGLLLAYGVISAPDLADQDPLIWLQRALMLDPDNEVAMTLLMARQFDRLLLENPQQVRTTLEQALQLNPSFGAAWILLAQCLVRTAQNVQDEQYALHCYMNALQFNPSEARVWGDLGDLFAKDYAGFTAHPALAFKYYEYALQLHPDNLAYQQKLADYLAFITMNFNAEETCRILAELAERKTRYVSALQKLELCYRQGKGTVKNLRIADKINAKILELTANSGQIYPTSNQVNTYKVPAVHSRTTTPDPSPSSQIVTLKRENFKSTSRRNSRPQATCNAKEAERSFIKPEPNITHLCQALTNLEQDLALLKRTQAQMSAEIQCLTTQFSSRFAAIQERILPREESRVVHNELGSKNKSKPH